MNTPQHHKIDIGASHGGASSRRPSERAGLIHYTKTADLKPHPLNEKLYGAEPVDAELLASIESNGILEPLLVTRTSFDGEHYADYIVSGHSR